MYLPLHRETEGVYYISMTTDEKIKSLEKRLAKLEKFLEPQMKARVNFEEMVDKAAEIVSKYSEVSTSLLQRTLSIGYSRAAVLLDKLEEKGIVGVAQGGKPRKVLKK